MAARINRRLVQWRPAAPVLILPRQPVVSFTFDDFPKSAIAAADIIERLHGHAGFYASTGFLGRQHPAMGEMFDPESLSDLALRGHEIGAHTHSHIDCAKSDLAAFQNDMDLNLAMLQQAACMPPPSSMAYPYGETSHAAKRWTAENFTTGRGVLPGVNTGLADRAQLRAVELGASAAHLRRAFAHLESCIRSKGWLIFFTHDVSSSPSAHGARPDLIEELGRRACGQGAILAAPTAAAALCGIARSLDDE
ncbi:MAG: polysaccharide deacetylase family protein [Alphaproteobacteria bacterium]|nr:polysaccharide deacetylase family protein [Alphaproteobacteria bacterium]